MTLIWKLNLPLTMKQLKEKSKTGENGFHYAHAMIRMMLLRKSRMMEYGAKHTPISPTKENGFIIGVIKLNDVGNNVQLVFMFYTIVKMNALQCTKQKMIIYIINQDLLVLINNQKK